MAAIAINPAKNLLGRVLVGGWKIIEVVPRNPYSSGGNFSSGYIAESKSGSRAYVKAMDLGASLGETDPARMINILTESFIFERDLLNACRSKKLNRVVTAIDNGRLGDTPNELVFYLVFELADGDVRGRLSNLGRIDLAWNLRTLHHVATALQQLHGLDIAHNDIKPSNVLLYRGRESKVGDLGRASVRGVLPPHEGFNIAGDKTYAPPEQLYGYVAADWGCRRLGCDAYLLGSLVLSLFTGFGMTHYIMSRLQPELRPGKWKGTYDEVLPFISHTVAGILQDFEGFVGAPCRGTLQRIITELCNPDPAERGHPKDRRQAANQYSLQRYVTEFDLLARKAELNVFH